MTQESASHSRFDARQFVRAGLRRLTVATGRFDRESDLKRWVEEELNLSYSAALRKLAGETPLEERELQKLAHSLGLTFEDFLLALACGGSRVHSASVELTTPPILAKVVLGEKVCPGTDDGLFAYESDGEWRVVAGPSVDHASDREFFKVLSLSPIATGERKLLFALIDDDDAVTQAASALFKLDGINSRRFSDEATFLASLAGTKYDAYIVDWFLAKDRDLEPYTAENIIRRIRESDNGRTTPIVVVTGKVISDNDVVVDELARVSNEYNCTLMSKPVQWRFVGANLVKRIKEDSQKTAVLSH
jgi:FixJ family two-component response regulator